MAFLTALTILSRRLRDLQLIAPPAKSAYSWPGNVREVSNVIERAVVLSSGPSITLKNLPSRIAGGEGSGLFENLSYRDGMNAARRLLILKALSRTQGNRSAAAKLLGLESKYLLKLMKALEIE